jgi:multidrug transporter EmrE-like cation transporter
MSTFNIIALSVAEVVGDFGFRKFAQTGLKQEFIKGSAGYIAVVYFLIRSFKQGNVTYVNGMWDGVSAIIEGTAAYLILGERLHTPAQYFGLAFIISGLFLLRSGGIAN